LEEGANYLALSADILSNVVSSAQNALIFHWM
jgi:hypothetical protein